MNIEKERGAHQKIRKFFKNAEFKQDITFFDNICFTYCDMSAGKTIYVDGLQTNIIGSLAVSDFIHIHQAQTPVIRTENIEVHEIGQVLYRSMHTVIKIGKRWIPIISIIISKYTSAHGYEL